MNANKRTIILSTHDIHFAYEWADEIIMMDNGEILYHGDPVFIFSSRIPLTKPIWKNHGYLRLHRC